VLYLSFIYFELYIILFASIQLISSLFIYVYII